MGFFDFLRQKEPEPEERDKDRYAVPSTLDEEARAPYTEAWSGYAPARSQDTHSVATVGRAPRFIRGEYPQGESEHIAEVHYGTAPAAVQEAWIQAPDPRWESLKKPAIRPQRTPSTFRQTNPFDWQFARHLNGFRFSMASHIRTYPIGGMKPAIPRRNTFRLMPPPHDINQTNVRGDTAFNVDDMDMQSPISAWRPPLARLR